MIIFNNAGHSFVSAPVSQEPIVWVDAQDISTYTLGTASGFGNELVVNGDFSDGLNGWGFFGQNQVLLNLGGVKIQESTTLNTVSNVLTQGKSYEVSYEIIENNNNNRFRYFKNDVYVDIDNTVGLHQFAYVFTGNEKRLFFTNPWAGSDITIDNISVKEVLAYDVTNLDNKGELGGVMTLNGNVKFANGGFESWSGSDYITRDLGEPFMSNNSFTMVVTFGLKDTTSGTNSLRNWFTLLNSNNTESVYQAKFTSNAIGNYLLGNIGGSNSLYELGLNTLIFSYDSSINESISLTIDGIGTNNSNITFDNTQNTNIQLLNSVGFSGANSGQNNPLHEFRLYNRAMSLVEMQNLQTELNNKYLILGNELVVNGDFATDTDWSKESGWSISGGSANCDGTSGNKLIYQNCLPIGANKLFRVEFEVLNYVSGAVYPLVKDENGSQAIAGITSNGVYTVDAYRFNANSNLFYFRGVSFEGSIDNISVKEILN